MSYNLSTKEGLLAQTLHVELDIHLYPFSKTLCSPEALV